MKKSVPKKNNTKASLFFLFFVLIAVLLIQTSFNSALSAVANLLPSQEERTETPSPGSQRISGGNLAYMYALSEEKEDVPEEYTRRDIENFLCASVENYITTAHTTKRGPYGQYYVKARENADIEKQKMKNSEICKWFEDTVTVTSRGNLTVLDSHTITTFYRQVNKIIGGEKFIYTPNLKVANIVIEMEKQDSDPTFQHCIGETSVLQDNLRVRLGIKNSRINIETYTIGDVPLILEAMHIQFTPEEMEFGKVNRLVKVSLRMELDPRSRHFSLVHELFHALGFSGHSPYHESYLFPYTVAPYPGPLPRLHAENIILTPLAERMVEILYRPEILSGMPLARVAQLLPRLKLRRNTPSAEIIASLKKIAGELETEKQHLLAKGKENFDNRMSIYILQDKLNMKELALLRELEEIKMDYKLPTDIIGLIQNSKYQYEKMAHILREQKIQKDAKKQLTEVVAEVDLKKRAKRYQAIKMHQLQIVVLNDLLNLEKEISAAEQKLQATRSTEETEQLEEELRRTERQLITLKKELTLL